MDYRSLVRLGRKEFLAVSAPALLLRPVLNLWPPVTPAGAPITEMLVEEEVTAPVNVDFGPKSMTDLEVYPLVKRPFAAFPELITVGRTAQNDVVIVDPTITRFHLYLTQREGHWWVADAGSKNGSWLGAQRLEPHQEVPIAPSSKLRLGDLELNFHLAEDAYVALGGK
ncbi:MAG: FHA domain-containing protein [Kofleriaceae bacterium]